MPGTLTWPPCVWPQSVRSTSGGTVGEASGLCATSRQARPPGAPRGRRHVRLALADVVEARQEQVVAHERPAVLEDGDADLFEAPAEPDGSPKRM
jgi:hypothetical protein